MPPVKVPDGSDRHSVSEIDIQLGVDDAPILAPACPFPGNVHHGQVQHFQQTVVRGKNGLGFGHLSQLAVKDLNGVGGIDYSIDDMMYDLRTEWNALGGEAVEKKVQEWYDNN